MHDRPDGPALLRLARELLLDDLMPLLPAERRSDALLIAKAMAIAEREAKADERPSREILRDLEMLYRDTLTQPARRAGSTLSRVAGQGAECSEAGEGEFEALRRFASDLRAGAFEGSAPRERDARALLWRLTIAKLRQANPQFLSANGLGEPNGLVGD